MSRENVELVRGLIPPSETDLAALVRDDRAFEAVTHAIDGPGGAEAPRTVLGEIPLVPVE
jgi:hypothetical protein